MELILQDGLEHQQKPVDAVGDVFKGVEMRGPSQFYENPQINLNDYRIINNIKAIQWENINKAIRNVAEPESCLNLDIKMETGTGKTFVYTKTMYELHKRYGINKFI